MNCAAARKLRVAAGPWRMDCCVGRTFDEEYRTAAVA